jgi:hypothetical protein
MGTRASSGANAALLASSLRLSQAMVVPVSPARLATARREIAHENHMAAIAADDVRWALAQQVQESLEGGRAALMRPESRRRLIDNAEKLGLRPFDANLVIAIVQDAARHGEPLDLAASHRLALVPVREKRPLSPLILMGLAVVLGAGTLLFLMAWLMG